MDNNGDRDPDYVIQTLIDDRFEDIAYYTRYNDNFTIREGVTIIWPGGVTTPPKDSPECGWEGELCYNDSGKMILVVFVKKNIINFVFFLPLIEHRREWFSIFLLTSPNIKISGTRKKSFSTSD